MAAAQEIRDRMKIMSLSSQSMRTSAQNAAHQGREDVVVVSGLTDLLPSVTEQLIQNQLCDSIVGAFIKPIRRIRVPL